MRKYRKPLSLILTLALLWLSVTACINKAENIQPSDSSANNETDEDTSGTTDFPKVTEPILADLNNDGTDDKIIITYEDEQKRTATIKVLNGKDDSELMTDTLRYGANKYGAYYLLKGKSKGVCDRLVFWCYSYSENNKVTFYYKVFRYTSDGEIVYDDSVIKSFDIGPDAPMESENVVFSVLTENINKYIENPNVDYNAYLLLDNQGEVILASTKDNMLAPSELTFTLEYFVNKDEGNSNENTNTSDDNENLPSSEMAIEEGYTIIAFETLTIPVTENKVKTDHTARVAALRNADGDDALYFDVLSADNNTVLSSITWKGNYQLCLSSEGTLILLRLIFLSDQQASISYQEYEVSDLDYSWRETIKLDAPQINSISGQGESLKFGFGSDAAVALYEVRFDDVMYGYLDALDSEEKAGRDVYMIADCYFNPSEPTVYSYTKKISYSDFEKKETASKFTWNYAVGLLE